MRSIWSQMPLVRVLLPVVAGVLLCLYGMLQTGAATAGVYVAAPLLVVALLFLFIVNRTTDTATTYRLRYATGAAVVAALLSVGYLLAWLHNDRVYTTHFGNSITANATLAARIIKPPVEKEKTIAVVAEVTAVHNPTGTVSATGKVLLYILRTGKPVNLHYGDELVFKAGINEFAAPKNPGEFNFKRYQALHNVYHRAFLPPGSWRVVATGQGNTLLQQVYKVRAYFLSKLQQYVTGADNMAVAAAIMLGYNDYMTSEITQAYTNAGTLHVLSVSGLHVGIMFLLLNFLLGWADTKGRKVKLTKAVFIIAFMWFYACLTGLSPSVLRSALMFSLIQIGITATRHVNIYNIVAGSALVLMLFNPYIIAEAGFQLSYLAVVGIVFLYPKLYALVPVGSSKPKAYKRASGYVAKIKTAIKHDWRWLFTYTLDAMWALVAVSVAAQLATLPLSLYYFHQFPNMFVLSNLVVIPLSNLVLFTGTALCAFGEVMYLNSITGYCFNALLTALNKLMFAINTIPGAVTEGISISTVEMLLLYVLLLLGCWLTVAQHSRVLIAALVITAGLFFYNAAEKIMQANQKQIAVYCVPKQQAVSFIAGTSSYTLFSDSLLVDTAKQKFHVLPHWWAGNISSQGPVAATRITGGRIVLFEGKTILVVDSVLNRYSVTPKLQADLVILSNNAKVPIAGLQQVCNFSKVVFDSSNKKKRTEQWAADCQRLNLQYYDVTTSGAYIENL
ncbi:MAG TPA: ComEC/Rec2 family competence protein [Chitinophagales bacterium]|nr:ComEC/Rec2 family competence protein [Chitinophagales bacterium]